MNIEREIVDLYVDDIIPNRFQPREIFDEKALKELSASIKEHGVIQPIIVRKIGEKYEIIAGERRYKASVMAGLTKIPAIIRNLDDKESSKVALLENLQRRDLTAIEEARTYQKILDLDNMTQDELGRTMGKSQAAIANKIRLLSLPDEVQEALLNGQISERHARSLLNLRDKQQQIEVLNKIITTRMTVRELDAEIKQLNQEPETSGESGGQKMIPEYQTPKEMEENNMSEPVSNTPIIDMNPTPTDFVTDTQVDINKIKEQAEDIVKPKEVADLNKLLEVPEQPKTEEEKEEKRYKFIPSFDEEESEEAGQQEIKIPPFDFLQTTPIDVTEPVEKKESIPPLLNLETEQNQSTANPFIEEKPQNSPNPFTQPETIEILGEEDSVERQTEQKGYQPFANTASLLNEFRQNNGTVSSNPLSEEKGTNSIAIPDLKTTINTIRSIVSDFEKKGLVVDLDEMDFENSYQITIKIDKNK